MNALRTARTFQHWQTWLGLALVGVFFFVALAAPWLAPSFPDQESAAYRVVKDVKAFRPLSPASGLPLGTVWDAKWQRHLDVWYLLIWGTRSALSYGLLVVSLTAILGVLVGATSAYVGGWLNTLGMGLTDAFLSVPLIAGVVFFRQFILMLIRGSGSVVIYVDGSLHFINGPDAWQRFLLTLDPLLLAFIIFSWTPYARLMNSVVLRVRQEEYIQAARALGAGHFYLIVRHLIPNTVAPAVVLAARDIGYVVLLYAGFAFIGLTSRSEWGVLLALARNLVIGPGGNLLSYWWAFIPPTLALVLFGISWSLLGDGLNDWLEPHR